MANRPDDYPCGCLVTGERHRILQANAYFKDEFGHDPKRLCQQTLFELITPASRIICESYVLPMLMHEQSCAEVQLTLFDQKRERIPIIISARRQGDDSALIYWSIHSARQRDKLYQELLEARQLLEDKAKSLQTLSETDELTGLLNRREFCRRCDIVLQANQRAGQPLSLMMLDIDHFKRINDEHGHTAGDAVLRQFGQQLRKQVRSSDLIGRFGGEEFVLLLPDSDAEAARAMAKRLHAAIGQVEVTSKQRITASIGIATRPAGGQPPARQRNFEWLFRQADTAMYQAKAAGRNQTVLVETE